MGPGLVVHPVEASLNSQRSQKAVLAPVPVDCRQVDRILPRPIAAARAYQMRQSRALVLAQKLNMEDEDSPNQSAHSYLPLDHHPRT